LSGKGNPDVKVIELYTGEVKVALEGILQASAVGSCVAVAAYDPEAGIGGMAHVMLPGASPDNREAQRTRYAEDGIEELIRAMTALGAQPERLAACIAGGGNILKRDDDSLCEANVSSVTRVLEERGITLHAAEVGGTERRSICLDASSGRIRYTVGDSKPRLLWEPGRAQSNEE
jgi:chemotaxis protein CheD